MTLPASSSDFWPGSELGGATQRVYMGILADLDAGRVVPGQRLIETDLAQRFAVGRNAVREAMQHLASRGVVDLSPNRSPAIRQLDLGECHEVLEVAATMTSLVARVAAVRYGPGHAATLHQTMAALTDASQSGETAQFSRARRGFYRTLLLIGANRELQRLFPGIGTHIIHAQFPSPRMHGVRLADYQAIARAVEAGDPEAAAAAAVAHVDHVRAIITELVARG